MHFFDTLFSKFWHIVLVGLCKLTGRDNFFFAKIGEVLTLIAFCAAVYLFTDGNLFALGVVMSIGVWACRVNISEIDKIRNAIESGSDTLPNNRYTRQGRLFVRPFLMFYGLFMLALWAAVHQDGELMTGLMSFSVAATDYFAVDFQGPTKSAPARALDWAKRHLSQISLGGIAPHPAPS